MKHKMSKKIWHMSEYTHNKPYEYMTNSKRFHDSILLIAANTNPNFCQDWNLLSFTNVASAHSSIQYRPIFWCHLIEVTHSYPHDMNIS